MPKFKKCPRCDVNYIPIEQEYCDICEAEMKGIILFNDTDEEEEAELCPKCHINYLNEGQKVCDLCAAEVEKIKPDEADVFEWEKEEDELAVDEEDILLPEEVSLEELVEDEAWDGEDEEEVESIDDFEEIGDIDDIVIDDEDDEDEDDIEDEDE